MMPTLKDIVLPLISVGFAIAASIYSLRRPTLASIDYQLGPSIGDAPELHILSNRVALNQLNEPNKIAACCAIIAAIFGALVPILTIIQHHLS